MRNKPKRGRVVFSSAAVASIFAAIALSYCFRTVAVWAEEMPDAPPMEWRPPADAPPQRPRLILHAGGEIAALSPENGSEWRGERVEISCKTKPVRSLDDISRKGVYTVQLAVRCLRTGKIVHQSSVATTRDFPPEDRDEVETTGTTTARFQLDEGEYQFVAMAWIRNGDAEELPGVCVDFRTTNFSVRHEQ